MPTYEYSCKSCGEHLEVVQSFKDEPLTTCPACGGTLRKVFGSIGIAFKGSGFYKTDSRSSSAKPAAKSGSGKSDAGASDTGKSDSGKSDSGKSESSGSASRSEGSSSPAPSSSSAGAAAS